MEHPHLTEGAPPTSNREGGTVWPARSRPSRGTRHPRAGGRLRRSIARGQARREGRFIDVAAFRITTGCAAGRQKGGGGGALAAAQPLYGGRMPGTVVA